VRQFVSTLAVTHNGVTTGPEEVSVNHPLTSEKMTFYQSGYSQLGYVSVDFGGGRVAEFPAPAEVQLALTSEGVMLGEMAAATGRPTADAAFILEQVKAGDLYAAGQKTGYVGPLTIAHLLHQRTGEQSSVLLTPEQGFATLLGGQPVTVRMSRKVENYSDFSYQRDPGLPILGLGWVLLVIGIAAALYTPFTQVQAREEASRSLLVVLGQNSQRDEPLPQRLRAILMHEA
jgi:hypothetical protein